MRRLTIEVPPLPARGYPVVVGQGLLDPLGDFLEGQAGYHRLALVADDTVARLHAPPLASALEKRGHRVDLFSFPAGEAAKTRATKERLEDRLLAAGLGRDSLILALGGGVSLDLAGFLASTFMRGVPFVALPTSVLAVVDSSIGGKTGVDTPAGKNMIGAFHPPRAVFADLAYLNTLPVAEIRHGMAEAIKHGLIASAPHLEELEAHAGKILGRDLDILEGVLLRSVSIKARFVQLDEREAGARKALNFGHTFAHALERLSGWRIPHGAAVARGLVAECELSARLGLLQGGVVRRVKEILSRFGLPAAPFADLDRDITPEPEGTLTASRYISATQGDKKARAGAVEYVLLDQVGRVARQEGGRWTWTVPEKIVREVLFPGGAAEG